MTLLDRASPDDSTDPSIRKHRPRLPSDRFHTSDQAITREEWLRRFSITFAGREADGG